MSETNLVNETPAITEAEAADTHRGDALHAGASAPLDFINTYADYADVLEALRIFHEGTAIQLVTTALNHRGVTIPLGGVTLSLDLWTALLSASGAGRSTTIGMAAPILKAAQMEDLKSSVRWGSGPAFYEHFRDNPCGLHVWGEMAERLKLLNTPQFATVKEWLTDRYDIFEIPSPFRYRVKGKSGDTPPIVFPQAPRINILGTSAEDWFFGNLAEEDSAGGFLARWMIVRAKGAKRDVPVPKVPDASLVAPLAARLAQIGQLNGPADLSAIEPLYTAWYSKTKRRFEAQPNRALAMAYWHRHRGHILKLAVIFEASQSATLKVSVVAWERAVKFAEQVEHCIFEMLPTGMNREGSEIEKMADLIHRAGPAGMLHSKLTLAFKHWKSREREERLRTLIDSRTVRCFLRQTTGRTAKVYVHRDHVKAYKSRHRRDAPCP